MISGHQEKFDAVQSLQKQVLILLFLKDLDEEFVAFLLHAFATSGWILQKLGKDRVCVAESCVRAVIVLFPGVHQLLKSLKQLQIEQESSVGLISGQV